MTWGRAAEVPAVPSDPAPGTTGALPWRNCMNSGYGKFATAASRVVVYTPCLWNLGEKVRSSSPTSVFLPALAPLPEQGKRLLFSWMLAFYSLSGSNSTYMT